MKKTIWLVVLFILVGSASVYADSITITFDNSPQSGVAGSTLTFDATMTNTTGGLLNLTTDVFAFLGLFTSADVNDSAFQNNWPLSLGAGQSYGSAALFDITIPLGTAAGIYDGHFSLTGGSGVGDQNLLGIGTFEIDVSRTSVVPEPGTMSLMLLGMFGLAAMGMKKLHA